MRIAVPAGRGVAGPGGEGTDGVEIALADAVAAVRNELLEAAARGAGEGMVFAVGDILLEFSVELREDRTAKAGFKAWVLSAEGSRSEARGDTHRVSITLSARGADGSEVLIVGDPGRQDGPGDVSGYLGR